MNKTNKVIFGLLLILLINNPVQAWEIEYNHTNLNPSIRTFNTWYKNNDSSPLILNINVLHTSGAATTLYIAKDDLGTNLTTISYGITTVSSGVNINHFIPAKYGYYITKSGNATIIKWYEWKTTEDKTVTTLTTFMAFCAVFIVGFILYKEAYK